MRTTSDATPKVLVTYGSERGGTEQIALQVAATLRECGVHADVIAARSVRDVRAYDAVVVGGALYALHWHADARRFVLRHAKALREREVFFFSSGPLDDSATLGDIPATPHVADLMAYVGARSHATFGGRLAPDAKGFVASKMAEKHAGDWRDWGRIDDWTRTVAVALLRPRPARVAPVPLPSRSLPLGLCAFTGVTALAGGAVLVASPDGSLLGMPSSQLAHSPFTSYLVPGLLLFALVGALNAWAAWLHLVRADYAAFASMAGGFALVVWIAVEMSLLRSVHWLQVAYLVIGLLIASDAMRRVRRTFAEWHEGAERAPHDEPHAA